MPPSKYSRGLVAAQVTLIGIILTTGPIVAGSAILQIVEAVGGLLGLWAILTVGLTRVRIWPEVGEHARLIMHGPYRLLRHPMYTSVLLVTLILVANAPSLFRWATWCALVVVLVLKLLHEERLLAQAFPEYRPYREKTWRLLPFLW
ncbi:MAG TPA: methyltransferase [Bacteroidota bacterium]|nr:methyltransferase [Bacteroidota bacterium]